jgi:hypothetical protein
MLDMAKPEHPVDPGKPVDPNFGVPEHGKPPSTDRPEKPSHELPHPDHPDKPSPPHLSTPDVSHPIAKSVVGEKIDPKVDQMTLLHIKINQALTQWGQESNIPMNHEYWGWVNEYRRLNIQPKPSGV